MNKSKWLFTVVSLVLFFSACDKVNGPYGENGQPAAQNSVTINPGTITGSIIDYAVTSSTVSDTSELSATWYYNVSGDTSFASVIFTWHGIKSDSVSRLTTPSGIVHFDDTLAIAAGSPYGTLIFHYIADISASGNGSGTVIINIVKSQAVKKVLLVDFTGHQCVYCPRGARKAVELENIYGDQVIGIAIHCGSFATVNVSGMYTYDFRTPEGNQLLQDMQISSFPNGSINFKKFNNSILQQYPSWGGFISNLLQTAPDADISINNSYNQATGEITTAVQTDFLNTLTGNYNIAVYLIEDSIVNWQKDIDATPFDNPNYIHRHVFRTSFNTVYGEQVAASPISGTSVSKTYSLNLNPGFDINRCSVVAFILNSATKEIVQADQQKILP